MSHANIDTNLAKAYYKPGKPTPEVFIKKEPERKHKMAVVIGRFEPLHVGHSVLFNKALSVADNLLVIVGSSFCSRNIKNPFTFTERSKMIKDSFTEEERKRVIVTSSVDHMYSDDGWMLETQSTIEKYYGVLPWTDTTTDKGIVIVGNKKDESSYYLDMFPQYKFESVDEIKLGLDATMIREILFDKPGFIEMVKSLVAPTTFSFIQEFMKTNEYFRLTREWAMVKKYKQSWEAAPYPVIFTTVDAVVTFKGHVLIIKRKSAPGENLLALPGGFLNYSERLKDGVIRELIEETKIDIPPALIKNSIRKEGVVFDAPGRSLRGRTITHAFHFELDSVLRDTDLPKVKGSDDASKAMWLTFSEVLEKSSEVYEDHLSIIRIMTGI
jgi:bifunctional NMN adenylyltransferase/nudix hydrolase